MKILFLGTGAADWCLAPADGVEKSRKFSSILIDHTLLIDPGPDVLDALNEHDIALNDIKYILTTHDHEDHLDRHCLNILTENGAVPITCTEEPFVLDNYKIEAVKGNHAVPCLHYLISDGASKLYYGLDGAWLTSEEYEAITKEQVDVGIFDATVGFIDGDYRIFEHNNLNMIIEMKKTLSKHIKQFYISHMAYTLHDDHAALAKQMKQYDIHVAFDGLELNI